MFFGQYDKLHTSMGTEVSCCSPFSTIYIPSLHFCYKGPSLLRFTFRGFSLCSWFNFDDRFGDSSILGPRSDIKIRIITVSPVVQRAPIRNNNLFTSPLQYVVIHVAPMHEFFFPQTPINNISVITFVLMFV